MRTLLPTDPLRAMRWILVFTAMAGGCATMEIPALPTWPTTLPSWPAKKDECETPASLAVVWTATVLQAPNATPTRGFGGLLTFYGADRKLPIKVDGQLTVYAYADTPAKSDNVAPDAKFVFPAEQLEKYYGQSAMGHSYSVWIPWDQAGGPQRELMLTACFKPTEGDLVMGKPARVVLEGPSFAQRRAKSQHAKPSAEPPREGQTLVLDNAEPSGANAGRRMITTTLSMPGSTR
ncbi:MAG: hypothetical protein U1E05_01030 [Patescibacteria group bacterium]|nr:hypothetical protein [Patescibacteria group bacterium]